MPQEEIEDHRGSVSGNLDEIVTSVGIRCGEERDHGLVDGRIGRAEGGAGSGGGLVKHIGEASSSMFEGLTEADELRRDGSRVRSAEPHDPNSAAPGRGRDRRDGVDDGGGSLGGLGFFGSHFSIVGNGGEATG